MSFNPFEKPTTHFFRIDRISAAGGNTYNDTVTLAVLEGIVPASSLVLAQSIVLSESFGVTPAGTLVITPATISLGARPAVTPTATVTISQALTLAQQALASSNANVAVAALTALTVTGSLSALTTANLTALASLATQSSLTPSPTASMFTTVLVANAVSAVASGSLSLSSAIALVTAEDVTVLGGFAVSLSVALTLQGNLTTDTLRTLNQLITLTLLQEATPTAVLSMHPTVVLDTAQICQDASTLTATQSLALAQSALLTTVGGQAFDALVALTLTGGLSVLSQRELLGLLTIALNGGIGVDALLSAVVQTSVASGCAVSASALHAATALCGLAASGSLTPSAVADVLGSVAFGPTLGLASSSVVLLHALCTLAASPEVEAFQFTGPLTEVLSLSTSLGFSPSYLLSLVGGTTLSGRMALTPTTLLVLNAAVIAQALTDANANGSLRLDTATAVNAALQSNPTAALAASQIALLAQMLNVTTTAGKDVNANLALSLQTTCTQLTQHMVAVLTSIGVTPDVVANAQQVMQNAITIGVTHVLSITEFLGEVYTAIKITAETLSPSRVTAITLQKRTVVPSETLLAREVFGSLLQRTVVDRLSGGRVTTEVLA